MRVGSIPWADYETLSAFRREQLDVAALTLDEAIRLTQTVADLQIILASNISTGTNKFITALGITRLSVLKCKYIEVEEGTVGGYILIQLLS